MSASSHGGPRPTAASSAEATPTPGFRLDIQGLRALAVVVVVLFHAGLPLPGGFVGVDMFFAISGFVITAMLMREWETTGRIALTAFYVRRFMRLTPALAVLVIVVSAASALILSPLGAQQGAGQTGLGAMLLSANFVIAATTGGYFDVAAELNPLLNLWSLSVEEQFYLVFPALLIAGWVLARRIRRVRPVLVVAAIAVVSFAIAELDSHGAELRFVPDWLFGFYGPGGRVWEFAVGAMIALLGSRLAIQPTRLAALVGMLGAAAVVASLFVITESTPFPGVWTLLPVAGTAALIIAGSRTGNPVSRLLATRPMQWMGDRSYSFYLWHWPFISFAIALWPGNAVAKLVAAALSLAPAMLSYRFVESRWRRVRPLKRVALLRVVAVIALPAIIVPAALWGAAVNGYWNPTVRTFQAANEHHLLTLVHCDGGVPVSALDDGACVFNAEAAGKPLYLVGDSNAGHFVEALIGAGTDLGSPVVATTTNGCPFVEGYVGIVDRTKGSVLDGCADYREGMLDYLDTAPAGVVVIAQLAAYWREPGFVIGADESSASSDTEAKLDYYAAALPSMIERLQDAGHEVLLVQQVPQLIPYEPQACSLASVLSSTCAGTASRDSVEQESAAAEEIIEASAERTGAMTLQLRDDLCGPTSCSTIVDGVVNYRDAVHISVAASRALAPRFEDALRGLLVR